MVPFCCQLWVWTSRVQHKTNILRKSLILMKGHPQLYSSSTVKINYSMFQLFFFSSFSTVLNWAVLFSDMGGRERKWIPWWPPFQWALSSSPADWDFSVTVTLSQCGCPSLSFCGVLSLWLYFHTADFYSSIVHLLWVI